MKITPRLVSFFRQHQSGPVVAVLALLSASPASATDLYWGSGGVAGAWTTAGNWFTDAAETTVSETAPTLADDVFFNTTPDNALGGSVTMSTNIAADSITFNASGATILSQSGTRTLTLGGGGITVNSGAGNSTFGVSTNSLSVQPNVSQTWTNHSGSLFNVRSLRASDTAAGPIAITLNAASTGNISFSLGIQDSPNTTKALSIIVDSAGTGSVGLVGSTYTGGTTLKRGVLSTNSTLGTGDISVAVADSTQDVRFHISGVVTNNITVNSGTGLRALTGQTNSEYLGNIILNRDVLFGSVASLGTTATYSGVISGNASITAGRVATGTSNPTVVLSGANTYTGKTTVPSASLVVSSFNSVIGGTASSALGAPTTVENGTISLSAVSTSTLRYTGTGETTDRVLDLAGTTIGAVLEQAGTGLLKFNGNLTATGAGSKSLTLRGSTEGTGEISGSIPNSTANTSITKDGTGTWRLSGLSDYTGATSISGGVLEVTELADGGVPSSIGSSTNTFDRLVFGGSSASTLRYVGDGDSTNRRFTIGGAGGIFDASGAAALSWTNTAAPNYASVGQARTITFNGTNTGDNTMSATIGDSGAGKTTIVKDGTGKWILTGNNTYTGTTTVTAGTLSITNAHLSNIADVEIGPDATLNLNHELIDDVDGFFINGIPQVMGEWGSESSDAPNKTARITGSGKLNVLSGPSSSDPYFAWINSFTGITVAADKEKGADPDKDGMSNIVEFALDGNPDSGAASGKFRSRIETVEGDQALVITLPVRAGAVFDNLPGPSADATAGNIIYTIAGTNDLELFNQGVSEIDASADDMPPLSNAEWTYKSFRLDGAVGGETPRGSKGFLRAGIQATP